MKKVNRYFAATFITIIIFTMNSTLNAQVPDPNSIQKIAIYAAKIGTSDTLSDSQVNYNITNHQLISNMFMGIEADTLRDCSDLEAKNNAYVYVKLNNGTRKVYHLYLIFSHFSLRGDRGNCYYVLPSSRILFNSNAQ